MAVEVGLSLRTIYPDQILQALAVPLPSGLEVAELVLQLRVTALGTEPAEEVLSRQPSPMELAVLVS
jgi:hypothetical protein